MIREALAKYAATLNKVWAHDRTLTIGASEIGQCARKTAWVKRGGKSDSDYTETFGARMRGTMIEQYFWEPAMQHAYKGQLLFSGENQKTFSKDYLSATPDGLIVGVERDILKKDFGIADIGSDCLTVECKSIDPRANITDPKHENVYQTHVQLGLIREQTSYKPNYALLSYTDASFWNEVSEFPIKFDPAIYDVAKQRAHDIMTVASPEELKPEGWIAGGQECEYCPFTKACRVERSNLPSERNKPDLDPQFVAEITELCRTAKRFETARDLFEEDWRTTQYEIKERLRDKGARKVPGVVTWSGVAGRKGYDNKAIREALAKHGVDMSQFETEGTPGDRLTIKVSGEERKA